MKKSFFVLVFCLLLVTQATKSFAQSTLNRVVIYDIAADSSKTFTVPAGRSGK